MRANGNFRITADDEYGRYQIKCSTGETIPVDASGAPVGQVVFTFYRLNTRGVMAAFTADKVYYEILGANGDAVYDDSLAGIPRLDVTDDLNSYKGRFSSVRVTVYDGTNAVLAVQSFGTSMPGKDGQDGKPGDKGDKGDPGEPGRDGQDGQDGVAYDIILSTGSVIPFDCDGKPKQDLLEFYLLRDGKKAEFAINVIVRDNAGNTIGQFSRGNQELIGYQIADLFPAPTVKNNTAAADVYVQAACDNKVVAEKVVTCVYDSPVPHVRTADAWSAHQSFDNGEILIIGNSTGSVYMWSYPIFGNSSVEPATDIADNPATTKWRRFSSFEMVATRIILSQYALVKNLGVETVELGADGKIEMKDPDGNVLFLVEDGNVTCNIGTFNNVDVQTGKIAGFTIEGDGLTNRPFTNDAYITLRNDTQKCFASIGGNVQPAVSGYRSVARFENDDDTDVWHSGVNVALSLSASGNYYNYAFAGKGNGIMDGWIGGYKFSKFTITKPDTIYSGYINMAENNTWIVRSSQSGSGVALPKLESVRMALGITSGDFCVRLMILADIGSTDFWIYGRNNLDATYDTTTFPRIVYWNDGQSDREQIGAGQSMEFLLVYDSSGQDAGGYSTQYTARIINKQTRT